MIENHISGYLYTDLFGEGNEEKCTAFQAMAWPLILHKNPIKICSTALRAFSFLSLYIFYFLFHKGKDTFAVPQPSVQHLVYVSINALIIFT